MATAGDRSEDWTSAVARVASLAIGATAISAALAFYMGWRYEKEYVEEWDLAFSSFSYTPYELMVASSATLLWASVAPLTFLLALPWPPSSETRNRPTESRQQ